VPIASGQRLTNIYGEERSWRWKCCNGQDQNKAKQNEIRIRITEPQTRRTAAQPRLTRSRQLRFAEHRLTLNIWSACPLLRSCSWPAAIENGPDGRLRGAGLQWQCDPADWFGQSADAEPPVQLRAPRRPA